MHISDSYRTRAPPKEHEEAVRMLLESIAGKKQQEFNSSNNFKIPATRTEAPLGRASLETQSSSSNHSGSQYRIKNRSRNSSVKTASNKQSKMTSTSEDTISTRTSGSSTSYVFDMTSLKDDDNTNKPTFNSYKEPIPSRTIAVQCDLKASSIKRRPFEGIFDSSMQASSISSTKYGFYEFSQETLDERRRIQRELEAVRANQYRRDGSRSDSPAQMEAPTSMSELSSSASSSLSSLENLANRPRYNGSKDRSSSMFRLNDDQAEVNSPMTMRQNRVERVENESVSGGKQHVARTRLDSLPRRPMTALSYVSSGQLKAGRSQQQMPGSAARRYGKRSGDADNDDGDEELNRSSCDEMSATINQASRKMKNHQRAYSHQVLNSASSMLNQGKQQLKSPNNHHEHQSIHQSINQLPSMLRLHSTSSSSANKNHSIAANERKNSSMMNINSRVVDSNQYQHQRNKHQPLSPPIAVDNFSQDNCSDCEQLARQRMHYDDDDDNDNESINNINQSDQFRVPRSEEIVLTKRAQIMSSNNVATAAANRSRPILLKSTHNEQVHELESNSVLSDLNRHLTRSANGTHKRNVAKQHLNQQPEVEYNNNRYEYNDDDSAEELDTRHQASNMMPQSNNNQWKANSSSEENQLGFNQARRTDARSRSMYNRNIGLGSMSLSRKPLSSHRYNSDNQADDESNYQATSGPHQRRTQTLTNGNRILRRQQQHSSVEKTLDPELAKFVAPSSRNKNRYGIEDAPHPVGPRSTSMRHIDSRAIPHNYNGPPREPRDYQHRYQPDDSYENSDSPSTRTWANPGIGNGNQQYNLESDFGTNLEHAQLQNQDINNRQRSHSSINRNFNSNMSDTETNRIPTNNNLYNNYRYNLNQEDSNSTNSSSLEQQQNFVNSTSAYSNGYDHRQNENHLNNQNNQYNLGQQGRPSAPSSYIGMPTMAGGLPSQAKKEAQQFSAYTLGRSPKITGRAMSQQSLTRPTMPTVGTGRRRTRRVASGSNSGSDVGGSSMSLVSRLNGRYENAHTRTPVIMYIPQVTPKPATSSSSLIVGPERISNSRSSFIGAKPGNLRKSMKSTSASKFSLFSKSTSSQDKLKRSVGSRNNSDSETSSMMRTLVKPRPSRAGSRRGITPITSNRHLRNQLDYDDENEDGVGQLMTETEDYKFKRRYSVPKDAKINWFAKLKQKVSSGKQ